MEKVVGLCKIEPISLGNGGLKLDYDKVSQDTVTYLDSFKGVHRKPVSSEFKGLWNVLKKHAREVFRMSDGVEDIDITVVRIKKDGEFGYRMDVKVTTPANTAFANEYKSCIINESNYAGYGDLELLFDQLEDYVAKYLKNKTKVNEKQILLDFRSELETKGKSTEDLANLESMDDKERHQMYVKWLEDRGAVLLETGLEE